MHTKPTTISGLLKPTPCSFVWKDNVLTKSDLESAKTYDLSESLSLEGSLAELSKEEDFITHLKVSEVSTLQNKYGFSKNTYFKALGYGNLELITKLSKFIPALPESFLNWCKSKKLGPKDFRVMMSDFNKSEDTLSFEKIADLNPSKNNGLLIIEYYFDLKSLDKIDTSYLEGFKSAENLLKSLKKKRFSQSLSVDESLSKKISKIQMTKGVSLNLKRIGDKRVLKFEAQSSSPKELKEALEKSILKLNDIEKTWNDK